MIEDNTPNLNALFEQFDDPDDFEYSDNYRWMEIGDHEVDIDPDSLRAYADKVDAGEARGYFPIKSDALRDYAEAMESGCCGFFDNHIEEDNGRRFIAGCNYGH